MVLAAQLLFEDASLSLASAARHPSSTSHTADVLAVLGVVPCAPRHHTLRHAHHGLDVVAAIMAALIQLHSPSSDALGQLVLLVLLPRLGGLLGVAVSALAVIDGYYLLSATGGAGMVTMSLAMTALMAVLALDVHGVPPSLLTSASRPLAARGRRTKTELSCPGGPGPH